MPEVHAGLDIDPTDDAIQEGNETVQVWLEAHAAYALGDPREATVTINDDAGDTGTRVSITVTEEFAYESGAYPGIMYVSREGPLTNALTVNYTVAAGEGHATAGDDYEREGDITALSGSVEIPADQRSARILITPIDDTTQEADERVELTLANGEGYVVDMSANQGRVTIRDNDAVITVTAPDADAAELMLDRGQFRFTRTGAGAQIASPLTVFYSVLGTAVPDAGETPNDYRALPWSITIPAGANVATQDVVPNDDDTSEPTESVVVTIDASYTYTRRDENYSARVTISDNDNHMGASPVIGDLSAARPYTRYLAQRYVPDALEDTNEGGVGIRRNGDDDDNDGVADRVDNNGVAGDDDLIPVHFTINLTQAELTAQNLQLVFKRLDTSINLWSDSSKTTALTPIRDADGAVIPNAYTLPASSDTGFIHVEWVNMEATAMQSWLDFYVRNTQTFAETYLDEVRFYPFNSIVIGFAGENQSPWDNTIGMNQMVRRLYDRGYDARIYDEDDIGYNTPHIGIRPEPEYASYYAVRNAVVNRGVREVAIFGYSRGAGATHRLAGWIADWNITGLSLAFTGYIDGVTQGINTPAETRRPPGSQWHYNAWQGAFDFHPSDFFRGTSMGDNANVNDDVEVEEPGFDNVAQANAIHGSDRDRGIAEIIRLQDLLLGIEGDNGLIDTVVR